MSVYSLTVDSPDVGHSSSSASSFRISSLRTFYCRGASYGFPNASSSVHFRERTKRRGEREEGGFMREGRWRTGAVSSRGRNLAVNRADEKTSRSHGGRPEWRSDRPKRKGTGRPFVLRGPVSGTAWNKRCGFGDDNVGG